MQPGEEKEDEGGSNALRPGDARATCITCHLEEHIPQDN